MHQRYELSEGQRLQDLLSGTPGDPGRSGGASRNFVNGVLWVLRPGAFWRDLPPRYGNWKTVHKRFSRWAQRQVWEREFADLTKDRRNECLMMDSTIIKVHQHTLCGKGGRKIRRWDAAVAD
jgi:putative transposase